MELPSYDADYANMLEPAHILFDPTDGEFAFGCVTGSFEGGSKTDAMAFDWDGNDKTGEVHGDGWVELQGDGSPVGEVVFHNGDEIPTPTMAAEIAMH